MKKILSLALVLMYSAIHAQDFEWVATTSGLESNWIVAITTDADGNTYTTGNFKGTVDFDPSPATLNLTSLGDHDAFVQKLNSDGELLWAVSFGGPGGQSSNGIALDADGNCFTTGYFTGTVDFDPSVATLNLTSLGSFDAYVQKLDSNGELIWAKSFGGIDYDIGTKITTDASGNCYTIGQFIGNADIDPAPTTFAIETISQSTYIQKLNPVGEFVWGGQFYTESPSIVYGRGIDVDASNNVIISGNFNGTTDFNPDPDFYDELTTAGAYNGYITKLNADGVFAWTTPYYSTAGVFVQSVKVDDAENIYAVGGFQETVDFDPSADTYNLTSEGNTDIFVQKLSPSGELVWANSHGNVNNDFASNIALDDFANCYTVGNYEGTIDFDPSGATENLTGTGNFIQKLDTDGNLKWVTKSRGETITLDSEMNCYTSGSFQETVDFDPSADIEERTSAGAYDGFLVRFTNLCDIDQAVTLSGITLTVAETGATYQWLDCDDAYAEIPGATDQSYTPITNGNYACKITTPDCEEVSLCTEITSVGITAELAFDFEVYPNPTNGLLHINTSEAVQSSLFSTNGQLILTTNAKHLDLSNLSSGIYILKASTSKGLVIKKIQVN